MTVTARYSNAAHSARAIFLFKVCGNILGFLRQLFYAFFFGTGPGIEAFFAASTMTNVSTKFFQTGALGNLFLPIFVETRQKDPKRAWRLASDLLTLLFLLAGCLSALLFLFAPKLIPLFVPGFGTDQRELVVSLFRITIPTILLDILSMLMVTVLHANRRFVPVEAAASIGNILMICVLLFLVRKMGITALAVSLLGASLMQFLILTVYAWREGFRFHGGFSLRHKEFVFLLKSITPFFGYMLIMQFQVMLTTSILSLLPQGSLAVVRYGSELFAQGIGLLSLPFSIVIFPNFSELALSLWEDAKERLAAMLHKSLQMLLFLTVPLTVFLVTFSLPIIQALYQRGLFDATSVRMTSRVFAIFCTGFFFECAIFIFKKLLFAFKKNYAVVGLDAARQVVYFLFLLAFIRPLGYMGPAAAATLTAFLFLGGMAWYVHVYVVDLSQLLRDSLRGLVKMAASAVVMALSCLAFNLLLEKFPLWTASNLARFLQMGALCFLGAATYLMASWLFKVEELRVVWEVYGINSFWRKFTRNGWAF